MQLLAYISEFGMAWFRLTCPFSLDWKLGACAHAQKDVNADVRVIGGAGEGRGGCKVVIEGAPHPPSVSCPCSAVDPDRPQDFPAFPLFRENKLFLRRPPPCLEKAFRASGYELWHGLEKCKF